MKAIILAAGTASRLRPLTSHTPKCLLKIGERTLLERSIDALVAAGVDQLCIVTGYLHEQIEQFVAERYPSLSTTFIHNAVYDSTNNIYSLWLARPFAEGSDVLLLDSDLLYDPAIARRVVEAPEPTVLTLIRHELGEEEMKVVVDAEGSITDISKTCSPVEAVGESLGIEKMGAAYTRALYSRCHRTFLLRTGHRGGFRERQEPHPRRAVLSGRGGGSEYEWPVLLRSKWGRAQRRQLPQWPRT